MSLIINIYYTGEQGNARRFAEEMISSGIVDKVCAEDSNENIKEFVNNN